MIVTVVGAGGKTTLSNHIGKSLAGMGRRILFTTTTKIFPPSDNPLFLGAAENISVLGTFMTAAKGSHESGKLIGYSPEDIADIVKHGLFDDIIVEADGAAGKPVKAPNDTEPVYPVLTDLVVGVIGLDCIGRPADGSHVHRAELFSRVTQSSLGEPITPQHIISLISHPEGLFRHAPDGVQRVVFLNKCDTINETVRQQVNEMILQSPYPTILTGYNTDWFGSFFAKFLIGGCHAY